MVWVQASKGKWADPPANGSPLQSAIHTFEKLLLQPVHLRANLLQNSLLHSVQVGPRHWRVRVSLEGLWLAMHAYGCGSGYG
jgi:hypothetical protein